MTPEGAEPSARVGWTDPEHPLWTGLLLVATAATVVPLWLAPHLPFSDLPEHAAQIATLRHWWDPAWAQGELFTLDLGRTQYLLYYLVGAVLAVPLGSAERANLVLLSLVAFGTPWSLRWLFRSLGLDGRGALWSVPLFWNQSLLFGLVNYLAALPLCFVGLALVARQTLVPRRSRQVVLALLAVAIYYLHLSALVVFLPAAGLIAWLLPAAREGTPKELGRRLLGLWRPLAWAAPVVGLCVLWVATSPVMRPSDVGFQIDMKAQFVPFGEAVLKLPYTLTDIWKTPWDRYLLNTGFAALGLLVLPWPSGGGPVALGRARLVLGLVTLVPLVLYFAMPHSYGWLWLLNDRYAVVAAMLLPGALPSRRALPSGAGFLLLFAVGLGAAVDCGVLIRRCAKEAQGLDEVLAAAPPRKRLLGLFYADESEWIRYNPYHHLNALYRARTGGVAEHSFLDLPQSPIRYRPEHAPPKRPYGWEWEPTAYRNAEHGPYFDLLLLRGEGDPLAAGAEGPKWQEIAKRGRWRLWAKSGSSPE